MKKLALGCGLVLVLTGMAAAGAAYFIYRQVSPLVSQFAEFGQVAEIERGVRRRGPFNPPPTAELTERQVEQLVQVQEQLRRRLGAHMKTFEAKYRELANRQDATLADLSLEEYRWIRHEAYRALGQPFVDLDVGKLVEHARRGVHDSEAVGELRGAIQNIGPESNRKLIERVKKLLEENLALAAFGL
jgi:hypothetical protein